MGIGFLMTLFLCGGLPPTAGAETVKDALARLKPGVRISDVATDDQAIVIDHVQGTQIYAMLPKDGDTAALLARLKADLRVVYAELNASIGAPEDFNGNPVHLPFDRSKNNTAYVSQPAYKLINMPSGGGASAGEWVGNNPGFSFANGAGMTVAVLDTGVTTTHPALKGRLVAGYNARNVNRPVDDVADGATNNAVGHGTMIAGLIARLAPGAKIMPIRVLNGDGIGKLIAVVKGVLYASDHGAKVLNLSFGCFERSNALIDAMDYAEASGVVVVASAGNTGTEQWEYPAAFGTVVSVASVDNNREKSYYSSYGKYICVVAPGSDIRSVIGTDEYADWSGTSFAAPFVTIEAALIWVAHPDYDAGQVRQRIKRTAHNIDAKNKRYKGKLGAGLIDIAAAIQ